MLPLVLKLKLVKQVIVEHTDLEMMEVQVHLLQIIIQVVAVELVLLEQLQEALQEMVEQEKIIVQYSEHR